MATPAAASALVVGPGQSIQAVIDAAAPGSTIRVLPGTYTENLVIAKDAITLLGSGPSVTRLVTPASPNPGCFGGSISGICVLGVVDAGLNVVDSAEGVRIVGFTVEGFAGAGIRIRGARGAVVHNNVLARNSIGIFDSLSTAGRYTSNSISSGIDGILIQSSTGPAIHGNDVFDNTDGIAVISSAGGQIANNALHDNCEGLLLFFDARRWTVTNNAATHNTKACPPTATSPPVSGIGIAIVGAHDNLLHGNRVFDNRPSGPTIAAGGIVLDTFLGRPPPTNNRVVANVARNNSPADIVVNQMGPGNVFAGNDCGISIPPGLCP